MKTVNIFFLLTFISFSVVGQNLITPTSVTGFFYPGSTNRAIDNSGLSSTPTTVASAAGVTHSSPATISEASYTPDGFSPITPWTFNFSTPQNLQGMVLWQPCSPHNGGDAPFNKITVSYISCGVNIVDTFILGLPSVNSKIIYFSQPIIGITSITLNVLESWSYNSLASGSCDMNVGWTSVTALPSGFYNVMLGEIKFIEGSILNPCLSCNLTANFSTSNTCFGDNTLFSDSSIDSLGTIVNWQWYFGDGDSIVGVNNPTHMYATSGTYNATLVVTNNVNCVDSITLNLTINNISASTDTQVACDSYVWIDGNTYTSSNNTATQIFTNLVGCDSIVTLDLTINNSTSGIDTQSTCGSYFWIDGNIYTSNNTTATHTIVNGNSNGCDSVVTLNLTVGSSSSSTDVVSACGSYVWIDGNTYSSNNTTAMHTIINGNISGCDSLITLNLTMNSNNVNITTTLNNDSIWSNALNAAYQWLDCNNNYTFFAGETNALLVAVSNGDYAVQVTQNGCIDTSACVNIMTIGIDENSFGDELLVYPNPTNGNFSIDLGQNYRVVTVTITTVSGKLIQANTYNKSQLLNLKLEEPAGIYFLNIQTKNKDATIRLLKK